MVRIVFVDTRQEIIKKKLSLDQLHLAGYDDRPLFSNAA